MKILDEQGAPPLLGPVRVDKVKILSTGVRQGAPTVRYVHNPHYAPGPLPPPPGGGEVQTIVRRGGRGLGARAPVERVPPGEEASFVVRSLEGRPGVLQSISNTPVLPPGGYGKLRGISIN